MLQDPKCADEPIPSILQQGNDNFELMHDLPPSFSRYRRAVIRAMIKVADEAVAAERERCAKIAEEWSESRTFEHHRAGDEIAAKIREVTVLVLVNPNTLRPTCFEPGDEVPRIVDGPYQNVARVTKEWQAAERERVDRFDPKPETP